MDSSPARPSAGGRRVLVNLSTKNDQEIGLVRIGRRETVEAKNCRGKKGVNRGEGRVERSKRF